LPRKLQTALKLDPTVPKYEAGQLYQLGSRGEVEPTLQGNRSRSRRLAMVNLLALHYQNTGKTRALRQFEPRRCCPDNAFAQTISASPTGSKTASPARAAGLCT
jgi:hypothetical protein